MRENRGKLKFTEESQNPASLDKSHAQERTRKKSKQRHKYKIDDIGIKADIAAGAFPAGATQSGNNLVTSIPSAGAMEQGQILNHSNPYALLDTPAQALQSAIPNVPDTPDSNAGVSAAQTAMSAAAGLVGQAALGKTKPAKPSKLRHNRNKLKFADDEQGINDVGGSAATQGDKGNSDKKSGKTKLSENRNNSAEQSAVDDTTHNNSTDSSTQNSHATNTQTPTPASQSDNQTSNDKATPPADSESPAPPIDSTNPPSTPPNPPNPADKDDKNGVDSGGNRESTDSTQDSNATPHRTPTDSASDTADPAASADSKPDGKLKFSKKEDKQISKLERKSDKYDKKLDKAKEKLPTKTVKKKERVYDEKKGKAVSKLTFEKEVIPIGEAKWNKPKPQSLPKKAITAGASMAVTKIHAKIHQVEHENVGVKAAHKAELMGESAYRGGKRSVRSAYRFHKNRPYRRIAKLEQKSIKNKMKLDYKRALRDNPKLKSNPISRFFQKRAIKRNYAKDLRNAQKTAQTAKKSVGFVAKVGKVVTAIIRKNPVFLVKLGIIGLIFFLIMSLFTMCMAMFSGGSAFIGAVTYPADYEDICDASVLMTELETDLRIYILEIEENHPDFDEYRLYIDSIGHNPFELIAFLSAVYHDFTFAEVEDTIRAIFDAMYTLELEEVVEIREREETRTGTGTDSEGNSYSYTYTVIVEYEWHILYVILTSTPMSQVIADMMNDEQTQHFNILMQSHGARQFIGNPFDFNWKPYFTSPFGYRVHPIHGDKRFHWGIDIGLPTGTPIRAGFDGVVVYVGYHPTGYGNIVIIENEDGIQARYAHCHEILVVVGQEVERGEVIATVGNTGASTGAHLHMEIAINGRRINPLFFVEFRM